VRDGRTIASPGAHKVLEAGSDLILIGDHRGEETFFNHYRS
jgi:K+/H+ antiporter YhaU regulatory subunit KhtT